MNNETKIAIASSNSKKNQRTGQRIQRTGLTKVNYPVLIERKGCLVEKVK